MELTVFRDIDATKAIATPENVALEVQNVYEGHIDAVLLDDIDSKIFMQTADGRHIEYQHDLTHYFVDNVSLIMAIKLFLSFVENNNVWKYAVSWEIDTEITAHIQAASDIELEVAKYDTDTDFEVNAEGILQWTVPIDVWVPQHLDAWRRLIRVSRRKIDSKTEIIRWEWVDIIRPIWETHPLPGEHHWRDQLRPNIKPEFDELIPVAEDLAVKMEALFWEQKLLKLNGELISNISTMRRMLRDTSEVNQFLTDKQNAFPELEENLRKVKENFAWYRAKKKINEAEIAEALGQKRKYQRLFIEAQTMLKQDWREVFGVEEIPQEETAKLGQASI